MYVGIDFGTSKSVIAVLREGQPRIIPDIQGHLWTPSLVMVAPDRQLFVGHNALTHPARYQSKYFTISSVKRIMGKKGEVNWGDFKTFPQEISALILGYLKIQVEAMCDEEITGAVLAVPAHFNINQRWATLQAADAAGLKVIRIFNEANAAALGHYVGIFGQQTRVEGKALVFDFGAGTLDVSVVDYGDGLYHVLATAGDGNLGGDDFDELVLQYLISVLKRDFGDSVNLDMTQQLRLRDAARKAKIELSSVKETQIYLPGLIRVGTNYVDLDVHLDRQTLEKVCKELFSRAVIVLQTAIKESRLEPTDLTDLLLIGGTSKMPFIREMVFSVTGLNPAAKVDPDYAVVNGAVIQAAILNGQIPDVLLLNTSGTTYSVGVKGDTVVQIINKNQTIPIIKSQRFTTTEPNQKSLTISVFEGESDKQSENTLIGHVRLSDLPPAPTGALQIEVTFEIDGNGYLTVLAKDVGTGKEVRSTIDAPYRLNAAQMKVLQRKVERELRSVRQQAIRRKEEHVVQKLSKDIEWFLSSYTDLINSRQASMLQSGKQLMSEYCDRNVSSDDLKTLVSSVRWSYVEALIPFLSADLTDNVKIRLIRALAATRDPRVNVPLIRCIPIVGKAVRRVVIDVLLGLNEMSAELRDFVEILDKIVNKGERLSFSEKLFLRNLLKKHKDLGDVINFLKHVK